MKKILVGLFVLSTITLSCDNIKKNMSTDEKAVALNLYSLDGSSSSKGLIKLAHSLDSVIKTYEHAIIYHADEIDVKKTRTNLKTFIEMKTSLVNLLKKKVEDYGIEI